MMESVFRSSGVVLFSVLWLGTPSCGSEPAAEGPSERALNVAAATKESRPPRSELASTVGAALAAADGIASILPDSDWTAALSWCNGATQSLSMGDFNGDGRADMLCVDSETGEKWITYASATGTYSGLGWHSGPSIWCKGSMRLLVGDFNGDGRADMLCHDPTTGEKWVTYADSSGGFFTTGFGWYSAMNWCYGADAQLFVADINGDGRADMLCHAPSTGEKWVALATSAGAFTGTNYHNTPGLWCSATQRLYVADFNGDKQADMLCHDPSSGDVWVAYTGRGGLFSSVWSLGLNYCKGSQQLHIADFNGDGRGDLLCSDAVSGLVQILFASSTGTFRRSGWFSDSGLWCNAKQQLFTANINGDRLADLLCHDPATGEKRINYSPL